MALVGITADVSLLVLLQIDTVGLPSWQAQLIGKKTWTLVPPPECQDVCHAFNVTMSVGDVSK